MAAKSTERAEVSVSPTQEDGEITNRRRTRQTRELPGQVF